MTMAKCIKGKNRENAKPKAGYFRCKDCDIVGKKKSQVCNPKKIKK